MIVRENINFQRGLEPKDSLNIGKRSLIEKWLKDISLKTGISDMGK